MEHTDEQRRGDAGRGLHVEISRAEVQTGRGVAVGGGWGGI